MGKSLLRKLSKKRSDQKAENKKESDSENTQPSAFRLRCDSSSSVSQNVFFDVPSTSKIWYMSDDKKEAKFSKSSPADDIQFQGKLYKTSKKSMGKKSRKSTKRSEEEFSFTKLNEAINFVGTDSETDSKKMSDVLCAVEKLNLGVERTLSSDLSMSDPVFSESLINQLKFGKKTGQNLECFARKSVSYEPFQKQEVIKGADEETKEFEEKKKTVTFKGIDESRTAAFFFTKIQPKPKKKVEKFNVVEEPYIGPEVTAEEDLATKQSLLDFFFYSLQLLVLTTIAISMVSSNMFYFSDITASLFFDKVYAPVNAANGSSSENTSKNALERSLRDSKTVEDFWTFAETTLLNVLYSKVYNTRKDPNYHVEEDDKILRENQILGVARIRQVRVKPDSCEIHPDVKRFFDSCYYHYSIFGEDTSPIKGGGGGSTATAFTYTEAKDLSTSYYWGEISIYGGGGYYLDLDKEKEAAKKQIEELKNAGWVSRGTRAVFIDFNVYNANVNLFCVCKIVVEFPPVGGLIASADFHSLKLIRYLTIFDFFILGLEFLYIFFLLYFAYTILKKFLNQMNLFFLSFWTYVDLVILGLSYAYIIVGLIRYFFVENLLHKLDKNPNSYIEFQSVKDIQINYNNVIAVLLFLSWIKLFTFLTFTEIMLQFRITLLRSLKDILGFLPMFLIMLLAFSFLGYLLFGDQVKHYNTIWYSFLALFQAFLGGFHYSSILETHCILGPLFYIAFVFFVFFLLLNVFIAIIIHAYQTVKSQVFLGRPLTGEYFRRGCRNIFCCCRPVSRKKIYKNIGKKQVLFNEILQTLKKAGFCSEEIKIFFCKYGINFKNYLEEKTKRKIIKDLELKRVDYNETSEQYQINVLRKRLDELKSQLEIFEVKLQPVIDKVDALLYRV